MLMVFCKCDLIVVVIDLGLLISVICASSRLFVSPSVQCLILQSFLLQLLQPHRYRRSPLPAHTRRRFFGWRVLELQLLAWTGCGDSTGRPAPHWLGHTVKVVTEEQIAEATEEWNRTQQQQHIAYDHSREISYARLFGVHQHLNCGPLLSFINANIKRLAAEGFF